MNKKSILTPRIIAAIEARKKADTELRAAIKEAFPEGSEVFCQTSRMRKPDWRTVAEHTTWGDPFYFCVLSPGDKRQELSVDHHFIQRGL